MTKQRAKELAGELYLHVFEMLDNEPDFNGYEAGEVAKEMEKQFINEIHKRIK